ncbi:MAG: hypothetical protein ABIE36_02790 [Candidatus Diapherotrites archaeon]
MGDKRRIFILEFLFLGLLLVLFNLQIISANSIATGVYFQGNVTANYDEGGVLLVNWTAAGSAAGNYTVYLWMNNNFVNVTEYVNNSATGYSWGANTTEANYTFTVEAVTAANATGTNATNVSMYVDRTVPLVNWTGSGYNNVTYKKSTDYLTLNISVGDVLSGAASGNSYCVFNISGTNETVAVSNGWCNTTYLNLTGLSDGNHTIDVWANDTVNNVGVNLSFYVVWVDTTAPPAPTFSCTPASVYAAETITCSCSGTDAGSGVNSTSYTVNPSTAVTGTFDTSCNITDNAVNSVSSSISYVVGGIKGSSSSSSSTFTWKITYAEDDKELEDKEEISKLLGAKTRVRLKIDGKIHYVGVNSLTTTTATLNISSTPQSATLSIGDIKKFEVTGDDFYDLQVILNSIDSNKANLTIQSIHEEITAEAEAEEEEETSAQGETSAEEEKEKENKNLLWLYIILGILVIAVVGYFFWKKKK